MVIFGGRLEKDGDLRREGKDMILRREGGKG